MTQEAPSTLCTWPLALPPESVLGWLPSSAETPAGALSHLQPSASRSHSLAGLTGRQENKGPWPVLWGCQGLPGKHAYLSSPLPWSWLWLNLGVLLLGACAEYGVPESSGERGQQRLGAQEQCLPLQGQLREQT